MKVKLIIDNAGMLSSAKEANISLLKFIQLCFFQIFATKKIHALFGMNMQRESIVSWFFWIGKTKYHFAAIYLALSAIIAGLLVFFLLGAYISYLLNVAKM